MKATTLLQRQRRNVLQLCDTVEHGSATIRQSLLPQLADDLAAHITVQELVFYPAACEALREETPLRTGMARHTQARRWLECALQAPVESEAFTSAIRELGAIVGMNADEEEKLLFPRLERVLDADALRRLGRSMLSLYSAKVEAGYAHESAGICVP